MVSRKNWVLWKKISSFVKIAFNFSTATFCWKILTCFSFYGSLNWFFSKICLKTWCKSVGTALYLARGAICRKQVFLGRLIVCSLFLDIYRKGFGLSAKKSAGCQNFILLLHKNILRKKITMFLWSSNGFFFTNSVRKLGQVCRNCIVCGQTSHSRITNGFRKANSLSFAFGFLVDSFWLSTKKYRHVCQNCIVSLTGKKWGRTFEQFCQCLFFRIFGGNFSKLYLIIWGNSVGTAL